MARVSRQREAGRCRLSWGAGHAKGTLHNGRGSKLGDRVLALEGAAGRALDRAASSGHARAALIGAAAAPDQRGLVAARRRYRAPPGPGRALLRTAGRSIRAAIVGAAPRERDWTAAPYAGQPSRR